jgi:hypothetical protein
MDNVFRQACISARDLPSSRREKTAQTGLTIA